MRKVRDFGRQPERRLAMKNANLTIIVFLQSTECYSTQPELAQMLCASGERQGSCLDSGWTWVPEEKKPALCYLSIPSSVQPRSRWFCCPIGIHCPAKNTSPHFSGFPGTPVSWADSSPIIHKDSSAQDPVSKLWMQKHRIWRQNILKQRQPKLATRCSILLIHSSSPSILNKEKGKGEFYCVFRRKGTRALFEIINGGKNVPIAYLFLQYRHKGFTLCPKCAALWLVFAI